MRQRSERFGAAFRRAAWHPAQNIAGRFRDFLDLVDRLAGNALLLRGILIDRGDISHRGSAGRIVRGRSLSRDRKSTRLNSSHGYISDAVFFLKKKRKLQNTLPLGLVPIAPHSTAADEFSA